MNFLRKMCLGLLSALFIFLLFATAFDVGFVRTATHPVTVKKIAADSGIYNTVVTNSLQQLKSINTSQGTIDAGNPLVQKAANQAITPQYVQQQANAAIDNIYLWLNGNIAQPNFSIDLNAKKSQFASNAAAAVQQQLAPLPKCTTLAQVQNFSVLNATCLPPAVTAQDVASQVQTDLNNSDFLSQANISSKNLVTNVNYCQGIYCPQHPYSQSDFNRQIPKNYQLAKKTPPYLAVLTVLSGLGIIFLSKTRAAGLQHAGISVAVIGVIMLALALFMPRVVSKEVAPRLKVTSGSVSLNLAKVVNDLAKEIDKNYWFFGGLYTIAGAGALTAGEVLRRRTKPAPAKALEHPVPTTAIQNKHPKQP